MAVILRPMNMGEILDRTFEIYRKNLLLFLGIAAIPELLMLSIHLTDDLRLHLRTLVPVPTPQARTLWQFALALVYFHVTTFIGLLYLPAPIRACSNSVFGHRASVVDSLRFAAARWRSYLWISVLKYLGQVMIPQLLVVVLMVLCGGIAYGLGLLNNSPVAAVVIVFILPLAAFGVFTLWLGARLAFAIPVAAFEEPTSWKAVRRGWALSAGGRWRITFAWGSVNAIAWTVMLTMQYLARTSFNSLYHAHYIHNFDFYYVVLHLIDAPVIIALGPVYPIALTLLYYDQRMRREGFDIERMMDEAGLTTSLMPPAPGEQVVNETLPGEPATGNFG